MILRIITHELITSWINTLREGNYTQGRIHLRSIENEFCIVGVLADQLVSRGCGRWTLLNGCYEYNPIGIDDKSPYILKDSWFQGPLMHYLLSDEVGLIRMNDEGMSFKELADYIDVTYAAYKPN